MASEYPLPVSPDECDHQGDQEVCTRCCPDPVCGQIRLWDEVAALDAIVKPQGWHVWVSSENHVYATTVKRSSGMGYTLDADDLTRMLSQLAGKGVRLGAQQ